jgi:2'-5' RNA ligase
MLDTASMNPPARETCRLFVAITVPDDVRMAIAAAQANLRSLVPHGAVRWVQPAQFHLTLNFLGDLSRSLTEPLCGALRAACAGVGVIRLRACGLGCFPGAKSPRVVWAGIRDETGQLSLLHERIDAAARDFAEAPAEGKFAGHITLGRLKPEVPRPTVKRLSLQIEQSAETAFGEWTAEAAELFESVLSSAGAQHSRLAVFPLEPRG